LTPEQYNKLLALLAKDNIAGYSANLAGTILSCVSLCWVIDSGASNHICTSLSLFSSHAPLQKHVSVQLPDGNFASVTHIGVVEFSNSLILKDVFYIPSFKFNLLSISQLTKQVNCEVIFSTSRCLFQDRVSKKMIGRGNLHHGLFYLENVPHLDSIFSFQFANNFDLWHSRLGHPCSARFKFLVNNFPDISANKDFICDVCPQAKQSRDSFPQSVSRASMSFQLLHVDIWGPFSVPSKNGSRFFLTIVDDYSRCTWVYLMKNKSQTFYMMTHFLNQVNRQFKLSISAIHSGNGGIFIPQLQALRSDNGAEFLSSDFQKWFHSHGIIHQRSCISTPQQNGIVERKYHHLLDVARSLRFQANLPLSFWGECILTAAFLINKLPVRILNFKSPHEILFGKSPSYSSLRVFGCLCFAQNMHIENKFDARGKPCIFVGYPYGQKGYRIYDPSTLRITVSRDIIFHESVFPYKDVSNHHSSDISITPMDDVYNNFPLSRAHVLAQHESSNSVDNSLSHSTSNPSRDSSGSINDSPLQQAPVLSREHSSEAFNNSSNSLESNHVSSSLAPDSNVLVTAGNSSDPAVITDSVRSK